MLYNNQDSQRTEKDKLKWKSWTHFEGLIYRYWYEWIKLPHFQNFYLPIFLIKSKLLLLTTEKWKDLSIKNTHCLRKELFENKKGWRDEGENKKLKIKQGVNKVRQAVW